MDHKIKINMLTYYASEKCQCENSKKPFRWVCKSCLEIGINLPESEILDNACNKHIEAAQEYLLKLRNDK